MTAQQLHNNKQSHWTQSYRDSFKSSDELLKYLDEKSIPHLNYETFLPKNFAQRIKEAGKESVLWKQFVPSEEELKETGLVNPIGDIEHSKGSGIIHRYKSRILFTPTINCPVICRYCFRKNQLSNKDEIFKNNLMALSHYLADNKDINEVILTGGDPLILSDAKLEKLANLIAKHSHIKFLRFHSRTPIILPERIDDSFLETLEKITSLFSQVVFCLHVNHVDELYPEVLKSLEKLSTLKISLKSQTVLLKDINDNATSLKKLFTTLAENKVSPYYLHHPDLVQGGMHFYLDLEKGRKVYNELRDELSGWMIPQYIIDQPGGKGKQLAFNPESFEFSGVFLDRFAQKAKYTATDFTQESPK